MTPKYPPRWRQIMTPICLLAGSLLFFNGWYSRPVDRGKPDVTARAVSAESRSDSGYVTKDIENLREGDVVLARDPETGEVAYRRIVDVFSRTTYHLRVLTIRGPDGEELPPLKTTDEHPFWVIEADAFLPAGELEVGDTFLAPDGRESTLISTLRESHPEGVTVWNFEVEGAHTYFVLPGDPQTRHSLHGTPVLVHNARSRICGGADSGKPPKNLTPRGAKRRGAFRKAKADAGIPRSQQPSAVRTVPDRTNLRKTVREYEFNVPGKKKPIVIREDRNGHDYGPNDPQNRGPHFNTPDGGHYDY